MFDHFVGSFVRIYRHSRFRSSVAVLCLLFFLYLLWYRNDVNTRKRGSWFCKRNPDDLHDLLWSHRGHLAGTVDGSAHAMTTLRHLGIFKFDVDIVYNRDVYSGETNFYVSHPTQFDVTQIEQYQTLSSFLDSLVIHRHHVAEGEIIASLEPKFLEESNILQQFLEYVNNHKDAAPVCGIVIRFKDHIDRIKNLAPRPLVSLGLYACIHSLRNLFISLFRTLRVFFVIPSTHLVAPFLPTNHCL